MSPNNQSSEGLNPSTNASTQPSAPQVIAPQQTAIPIGGSTHASVGLQPASMDTKLGQAAPVAAGVTPTNRFRWPKKKLAVLVIGLVVLLGGGASAYYLGIVVPHNPKNLWHTALDRTARGYDELAKYATANKDAKGVNVKGDYKLEGSFATDGTFDVQTYEQTSLAKFDIGVVGSRINVESRFIASPHSRNPDIYIKANGLKGLESLLGDYAGLAKQYDNQWLFLDHTLLDNLESMALKQTEDTKDLANGGTLTADDIDKIAKTVGEVNKEYLFTTDSKKAALTIAKEVGKEKRDGRDVYHYEVGLHTEHTKDYLNAMADSLQNTPATKLTNGKKVREAINLDALLKSVDAYKESNVAHVYVDLKTKLIGAVRIETSDKKQGYIEVSQNYQGGDVMPFKLILSENEGTGMTTMTLGLNINKKTNNADGNVVVETPGGTDGAKSRLSMKFTSMPNSKALDVQKPDGAKSVYELLEPLLTGMVSSTVEDTSGHNIGSEI